MNLLLLSDEHFISPSQAVVTGYQFDHLIKVHKACVGDEVKIGKLNSRLGTATINEITEHQATLSVKLDTDAPKAIPLTLILALPRPKMLNRILQSVATVGIKKLYLINSYRVEKSYWSSPFLSESKIQENLHLGLEQGFDTVLPTVEIRKRFKPFVEDELPAITASTRTIVGHPKTHTPCPQNYDDSIALIVGPEGGFIPYEIDLLSANGAECVNIGPRILRVEQAIPALVYRILGNQALSIG
jgi:RsmE family RNA methyltransferase